MTETAERHTRSLRFLLTYLSSQVCARRLLATRRLYYYSRIGAFTRIHADALVLGPTFPVIPSIRIYASRWRIYRLPHRLEPQDNPGREPKVILRSACELGHEVVRLNQAPMNPVDDLRIDAASECQREGRMSNSSRAVMCSADEQVTKWRYFVGRH